MHISGRVAAAIFVACLFSVQVQAATIFFGEDLNPGGTVPAGGNAETARNDFLSNLTAGVNTEDFDGFVDGTTAPLNLNFTGGLGPIGATMSGTGEIENSTGSGRFPTSGANFWEVSGAFVIDFLAPVAAFGFYGIDIGDFNGQVTVQTQDGSGNILSDFVINNTINGPNGSLLFWGLIDVLNPFQKIVFGNTNAGTDFFGFDDLTVGDVAQVSAVPVPAALPLFAAALGGMGFAGWRRRRKEAAA